MSPIVANEEQEAQPVIPAEAYEKADELRAILNGDYWEEEKIQRVAAVQVGDLELQLAVGLVLTPAERRAWHEYFTAGYKRGMSVHQE